MTASDRSFVNQANAALSTGPKTPEGKQRASMNAVTHGLTGQRMILQEHEHEAYRRLTDDLNAELKPATGMERQLVQKIIDCHTRLNRIAALDNNILNIGLLENTAQTPHDDETECMVAQTRSWLDNDTSFEKLGRYEARISRQLLAYTKELERLQTIRREQEREQARSTADRSRAVRLAALQRAADALQDIEIKPDTTELASFCSAPESLADYSPQPQNPAEIRPQPVPQAAVSGPTKQAA